ncbi:hypothetical protein [Enterobacter cloacae complex sp. 357B1]|uniref:hypothetical protein n=1 Tax=Enterobacter cloacae complex sp. 357B1 TaxID=3395827 RepID=UPI003CF09CEB
MEVEKIDFEWGTEYRCYVDEVLTSVILQSGGTLYFWNDEYCRIRNIEQDIQSDTDSPVFGLRFIWMEQKIVKDIVDMFLPGLKAQPTIDTFPLLDSEYH